jgi:hypothetical protein
VFVVLNRPGQAVQYFVLPGHVLHAEPERFSKWFLDPNPPGIPPSMLTAFVHEWGVVDEPALSAAA